MHLTHRKELDLSQRTMSPLLLSGTKVMDKNGIWQWVDSVYMQPTSGTSGASSICKPYTLRQDEQITLIDQIIPVNAEGAWNMKGHNYIFELNNWYVIDGIFKALYMIEVTVYNPIKEVTI